jgi:MFS family permease
MDYDLARMRPMPAPAWAPSYRHDAIFCFLAVLPTFAALVPVVAAPAALRELGDGGGLRAGFLASSIAGLAAGYIVIGNLADRCGQRTILRASLVAFCAFSVALYLLKDAGSFLFVRFLHALSSSACMVIPQALYRDAYPGPLARRANAVSLLGTALGPIAAFLLGGAFEHSWRSGFIVCAVCGAVAWLAVPQLPFAFRAREEKPPGTPLPARGFAVFAVIPACCFAGSYVFFVTAPLIAREELAMRGAALAWLLCLPPIGLLLGSAAVVAYASRAGAKLLAGGLVLQIAVAIAASLLALQPSLPIFLVMLLYGIANGLTVSASTAAAIARYPGPAGAAAAATGFVRMTGAAIGACALAATAYWHASAVLAACLALVAVVLAALLAPAYRRLATAR